MHEQPSPLAGKTVRIKAEAKHPQVIDFGNSEYRVEDWWDRVAGKSWMELAATNPACLVYAIRSSRNQIPIDDEVLYGKIGHLGHLVHLSEIEETEIASPEGS